MTLDYGVLAGLAEEAARAAGVLLVRMQRGIAAREKGPKDLVTEADMAAQRLIAELVASRFPAHQFIGEESPQAEVRRMSPSGGYRWIVDPLDGTTNYAHGMPSYAVSIAVEHDGQIVAGVIHDPVLDECFRATRGGGAALNGVSIRPSTCRRLDAALVAASLPANIPRGSYEIAQFVEVLHEAQSVRRLGSAALNMCYVACGRLDAYWAGSVKAWDVAAGALLLEEAGAVLTSLGGHAFQIAHPDLLATSTVPLHRELLSVLARIEGGPPSDARRHAAR